MLLLRGSYVTLEMQGQVECSALWESFIQNNYSTLSLRNQTQDFGVVPCFIAQHFELNLFSYELVCVI